MKQSERDMIRSVRLTLERIEVRGSANLEALLGCMQALDGLLATATGETEVAEDG